MTVEDDADALQPTRERDDQGGDAATSRDPLLAQRIKLARAALRELLLPRGGRFGQPSD